VENEKYGDEKFIYAMALREVFESQKKEAQKKRNQAITVSDNIVIGGIAYGFKKKRIFNGSVSVIIPDKFGKMNAEAAKLKYASEHRPQYIYTNALCGAQGVRSQKSEVRIEREFVFAFFICCSCP